MNGNASPVALRHTRLRQPYRACLVKSSTSLSDRPSMACVSGEMVSTVMPGVDARQRRYREEQSAAIGTEPLRLDDGPGPVRRADVEIGHVLVPLRDTRQHRRVVPERRIDIPARQIAVDRRLAVDDPGRVQQQENADRHAGMVEHIAEPRIAVRDLAGGLAAQSLHPVFTRPADETARQKVRDRIDVGLGDFATSGFLHEHGRLPVCRAR